MRAAAVRDGIGVGLLATLALLHPYSAHASGNAVARFGGEHGTVNDSNPTALYYNPGALGFSTGTQLFLDGQLAIRQLSWMHAHGSGDVDPPEGYFGANYGVGRANNVFGAPMLGATFRLGHVVFGAAAYAPFGGNVTFDENQRYRSRAYPGAQDGVARWHGIEAATKSIYGTVGLAYRFGRVSIGVTGNLIFTSLALTRAQSLDGSNDLTQEGRSTLEVSGVHGSFGLGVMAEVISNRLFLSLSYQAQPGLGTQALNGSLQVDASAHQDSESFTRNVTFHQALPDIWRAGIRYRVSPTWELRAAADLTRWSVLQTQCVSVQSQTCQVTPDGDVAPNSGVVQNVRRYWQDTMGIRVGGSMWVRPSIELFAGMGYENGATPDQTLDPVLADGENVALALGSRVELMPTWFIAASYTHLQFLTRDTTGKSSLAAPGTAAVSRRPDAGGVYRQSVEILNVNVTKTF